ncbi:MAG: T9SS type A sorting domain-containing protein, partial [Chitinophagaceae bacterium]|nr:T9SS type A sorting domain-containing protein [Chitinophagaceae bacterium]
KTGIITTIAGTGVTGFSGDGGPASAATFNAVGGIALDDTGNLYVLDVANYRVRKINRAGIISTIAGNGVSAYSGDGGPALSAQLKHPFHITTDLLNNIYISEVDNGSVRKISTSGIITTVVGDGVPGFAGDGGPATLARLYGPQGLAVDSAGNLYIGDASNARLRKVSSGNSQPAFSGGKKQYVTVCENATGFLLDTILSVSDVDAGQTLTWQLSIAPAHGTATVSYSTAATGTTLMPSGLLYTPTPGYSGTDTFTVRVDDGITANKTTIFVTVTPFHSGTIIGSDSVCVTDTVYLSNTTPGGLWSSSAPGVATINASGMVVGVATGTCQLSYTVSNSCGVVSSVHPLVVRPWSSACLPVSVATAYIHPAGIQIFPNPVANQMKVEVMSPSDESITLRLFDATGRLLTEISGTTNKTILVDERSVKSLPDGVYTIKAVSPHNTWAGRFIISR